MLRKIGCRAHDYGKNTLSTLAGLIHEDGYQTVQLAPLKAIDKMETWDDVLDSVFAHQVNKVLNQNEIDISVLGAYLNYTHPDDDIREANLEIFRRLIASAKYFGCRVVGTETGSLDSEYARHPMNHQEEGYQCLLSSMAKITEYAKSHQTDIAVEAVSYHIIHTPRRMKRLIDDIACANLKVICDITNMITFENQQFQDNLIHEMFDLLEDRIVVVHLKDFIFQGPIKLAVPLGEGLLNMSLLADRVAKSSQWIDVLTEEVRRVDNKNTFQAVTKHFHSLSV